MKLSYTFAYIERFLRWIVWQPLFPAQIALLVLAAWGQIGVEYGVERLFWSEATGVQFGSGLGVGMLAGVSLYVWYLLDRPGFILFWIAPHGARWRMFGGPDPAVRRAGAYLLWMLIALLAVILIGKAVAVARLEDNPAKQVVNRSEYIAARGYFWPFVLGYVGGMGFAWLLGRIDVVLKMRQRIMTWPRFQKSYRTRTPGFRASTYKVPPIRWPIHAVAVYMAAWAVVLNAMLLIGVGIVNEYRPQQAFFSPATILCFAMIAITMFVGYAAFHFERQLVTWFGAFLLLAGFNSSSCILENDYKNRFPGLDYSEGSLVRIDDGNVYARPGPTAKPLLKTADVLKAMHDRWHAEKTRPKDARPKIAIVATSGGGIRAAVWTAVVLEGLETKLDGADGQAKFRDHLRLFTGASGGMVGAALYVAEFDRPWATRKAIAEDESLGLDVVSGTLAEDSLFPTLQTAVLRDFSRNLLLPPGWVEYDRGWMLEDRWTHNARRRGLGPNLPAAGSHETATQLAAIKLPRSPYQRSFAEIYDLEKTAQRPSMVFSPMMVEDSRRLLVSNLDVANLTTSVGKRLDGAENEPFSRSGLELFKLFPAAHGTFRVGTAARMSATFPVVTPAVSLPTIPPRRLVDAGYFDNYGLDLAAMWLVRNKADIEQYTSGVVLIEIRAFDLQKSGVEIEKDSEGRGGLGGVLGDSMAAVNTPLAAVLRARGNSSYHRNNELLVYLDRAMNSPKRLFESVVFELREKEEDVGLNWYLSSVEKRKIAAAFFELADGKRTGKLNGDVEKPVAKIKEWFGPGGN